MQIFNTLTRQKEEFVPQVPGEYRIYVCGPTVYNYIHIGNARPLIVFDTLRRYLEYRGNKVIYVSNITDIDDKLIKKIEKALDIKLMETVQSGTTVGGSRSDKMTLANFIKKE